jgi:hypothetical protein
MKKLYENKKYYFQRKKTRAQVGRKSSVLRPTCALPEGFGSSAQVGRKLSHEQNRLMRTKEHPAPGKTTLFRSLKKLSFWVSKVEATIILNQILQGI